VRIVWLSPRWPFPPDDGAKVASAALLEALAASGAEVSLAAFRRGGTVGATPPEIRAVAVRDLPAESRLARGARALGSLFADLPLTVAPFAREAFSWTELRTAGEPDALVVDGAHAFAALPGPSPWPLVYRAHNRETSLWEQAADRAPVPLKPYYRMQAAKMRRFEGALVSTARAVAAISEEDAAAFRTACPGARVDCVPVGFRFAPPPPPPTGELTLAWVGRMDWPPNRDGLDWFLRAVWPTVHARRPRVRLLLAGSGDASWLPRDGEGVEILGRVDDPAGVYARAHAAIAPIRFGGGTKIKVIEAARFGRTVFATPNAFRGSALPESAMPVVSDDAQAWIEAIVASAPADLARRGTAVYDGAKRVFDAGEAARRFTGLFR
jgi:glycosyltransferase involved in cell wall biosynthesis